MRSLAMIATTLIALSYGAVGVVGAGPAAAAGHPAPANPTDGQLRNAAAQKAQAAADVGRLSGLVASIDAQISALDGKAELAKEMYLRALSALADARTAAMKARATVTSAQHGVDAARARFKLYIAAAYMHRGQDSSSLLTARDPNALLVQGDLSRYTSARQMTGIGDLALATVTKSNADAAARIAVTRQVTMTTAADVAQRAAVQAVADATIRRGQLQSEKAGYQAQLQAAGEALTGLQNKRAAYQAWQVAEAARKAAEAARLARLRQQEIAAQAREAARQERLAADAAAAAAAAAAANNNGSNGSGNGNSNGSNSGGGNTGGSNTGGSNTGGNNTGGSNTGGSNTGGNNTGGNNTGGVGNGVWTPAKGRAAADRALQWLGEPYSFAAGNANGPTWGACVTADAGWNDCHVFGFDCSGLALYAWAPAGIYMDHFAMTQYGYGSVHPSVDQLMPGDLVFWSSNGAVSGIHHVAIYIGGGNVVQAPQSGDVVKISPLWPDGYYGATRPGT